LLSAVAALGYPRPPEGTENISKLMEEVTLVCTGEVTSAPSRFSLPPASHDWCGHRGWKRRALQVVENMVDLVGMEPTTSSMPWNYKNRNLLTANALRVGRVGKNR